MSPGASRLTSVCVSEVSPRRKGKNCHAEHLCPQHCAGGRRAVPEVAWSAAAEGDGGGEVSWQGFLTLPWFLTSCFCLLKKGEITAGLTAAGNDFAGKEGVVRVKREGHG